MNMNPGQSLFAMRFQSTPTPKTLIQGTMSHPMTRFNQIERISRNNPADAQQFTVDKQADKYLDLYRDVLSHD